jgi:hypothetical protein
MFPPALLPVFFDRAEIVTADPLSLAVLATLCGVVGK